MYLGLIILTMGLLLLASMGIAYALAPGGNLVFLIGKWFVSWTVGVRPMFAGLRQILSPAFTANAIFRIKDPDARNIVMELGFGSVSMAPLALLSFYRTLRNACGDCRRGFPRPRRPVAPAQHGARPGWRTLP
jgi:hypothetical protein